MIVKIKITIQSVNPSGTLDQPPLRRFYAYAGFLRIPDQLHRVYQVASASKSREGVVLAPSWAVHLDWADFFSVPQPA